MSRQRLYNIPRSKQSVIIRNQKYLCKHELSTQVAKIEMFLGFFRYAQHWRQYVNSCHCSKSRNRKRNNAVYQYTLISTTTPAAFAWSLGGRRLRLRLRLRHRLRLRIVRLNYYCASSEVAFVHPYRNLNRLRDVISQ